jgi:hypothetical protein
LVRALALCGRSDFAGLGLSMACGRFASVPEFYICVRRRLGWALGRLRLRVGLLRPLRFRRARFGYGLRPLRFFSRIIYLRSASAGLGLGSAWFARRPFAADPTSQGPAWAWLAAASFFYQELCICVRRRLGLAWGRFGLCVGPLRPFRFRSARLGRGLWLLRRRSKTIHLR